MARMAHDGRISALTAPRGSLAGVRIVDFYSGLEISVQTSTRPIHRLQWLCSDLVRFHGWGDARRLDVAVTVDLSSIALPRQSAATGSASTLFSQAFQTFQRGDFAASRRDFQAGLDAETGNAQARFHLGETYLSLKDNAVAAREFRRVHDPAPASKEAAQAGERLAQLGVAHAADGQATTVYAGAVDPRQALQRVTDSIDSVTRTVDRWTRRPYQHIDDTW